ncbi:uncharacterized protein N7459_002562 [Penicillium hispanicum]|uniref:uncharacterized protein n=1 Tax=Penicillium hispanicum TaxID=1080232 RepID=UPI002540E299|nr:uncharacterized protein N7459_002562 [Penicillium hispanicum]KAJ5586797.1 hypothetical protein N7459_002562 [Penicillium hispanicum]
MSEPAKENVRASAKRGTGVPVATLLRSACTASLERQLHTPRARSSPGPSRVQTRRGVQRTAANRPCRSKSGVKKGLDMKEPLPDARDTSAARSSDERLGDFVQREVLERPFLGPV